MKTKKYLKSKQRALIIQLHKMNWPMRAIAKEILVNCSHSTVSDTIKRLKVISTTSDRQRSGHKNSHRKNSLSNSIFYF